MKQSWEIKKLAEVCEFGNGLWTGKKPPFQKVGVIRNTNFTKDGKLDDTDIVYLDVEQSQFTKRKLQYGDIILEKSGGGPKQPVGRVIIFDKKEGDFSFSNFTSAIRISNPKAIDFTYLHRFLFFSYISGATEPMQSHSTGIRNLKFDDYKAIQVPLPPLPEQQRIVSILDEAFAAIAKAKANAEQNLKNAKELFESYLQGIMSESGFAGLKDEQDSKRKILKSSNPENQDSDKWEVKRLGEVAEHSLGKMLDKAKNKGVPQEYLRNQNVRWFEFDLSDLYEMPFLENENEKYTAIKGDIMICEGGYPGRAAIWEEDYPIFFQKAIHRVRFHKQEYNKWFLYYLFHLDRVGKLKEHFTGAGIQHFTGQALEKLTVPIPPLYKVSSIVARLDALSAETKRLETIYQQKIVDLEELKKSVLQKAFNGEL